MPLDIELNLGSNHEEIRNSIQNIQEDEEDTDPDALIKKED
jgi:hypothetical protein